jgi:LysM repeat protein
MAQRLLFAALIVLAILPSHAAYAQAAPLFNETFDGEFANDSTASCADTPCAVPAGWQVWWTRRTETDAPGTNFQPAFRQATGAPKARTGNGALNYLTNQATHTGGVYRVVTGVTAGTRLRLSGWGYVWSTQDDSPISSRPSRDIRLKIGIDPTGGDSGRANPFSPNIIWSSEQGPLDTHKEFVVEADASASTVIVYLYSTMRDPVRHNEVFWDDVALTPAGVAATTAPTVPAAAAETPTAAPAPTAVPAAAQDETHTVVSGDTWFAIAIQYSISSEELQRLNPDVTPAQLALGQKLVIRRGAPTAADATAAPAQPAQAPSLPAGLTATPTETAVGAACVLPYFDEDGDGKRSDDGTEDLVPQILFKVSQNGQDVGSYTSNGVDEPHCFQNLANGEYVVAATLPQIYVPTTPLNDRLRVRGGQSMFFIGIRKVSDGNLDVSDRPTPVPSNGLLTTGNALSLLAVAGGGLMAIGLVGFLVNAFLRRRRL